MKRIGIVPVSGGAGAGFVMAMLATELAAVKSAGSVNVHDGVAGMGPGEITAVELGRGNLFDQLCADRWFRVRQMVSYWNCVHSGGQVERIINPRCGVNWFLRTPEDRVGLEDVDEEDGPAGGNLERGRAVKLLYSLPGDVAFVDFSSVNEAELFYLLEDMDQIVVVVDPLPSKLLGGYERICRMKLWKKPVIWTMNRWTGQIDVKELRKVMGSEGRWVTLPEIPRELLHQGEYSGCGFIEHQQIRRAMAPGMEEIIRRLRI